MVMQDETRTLKINLLFGHPFEGQYLNLQKPVRFGVVVRDKNIDFLKSLNP
jgi:hypothetical protein